MTTHEMTRVEKASKLDQVHEQGKQTQYAAGVWAQQQNSVHTVVSNHAETISTLSATVRGLEQQVKAMARVLASQNVQKLAEQVNAAQRELENKLTALVNEKQQASLQAVEVEVHHLQNARTGLAKKIDDVENNLIQIYTKRFKEMADNHAAIVDETDKVRAVVDDVHSVQTEQKKALKLVSNSQDELKMAVKKLDKDRDVFCLSYEKQFDKIAFDIKRSLDEEKSALSDEAQKLAKLVKTRDLAVTDKFKAIYEVIEKDQTERGDAWDRLTRDVSTRIHNHKTEMQKLFSLLDHDMERKVSPFLASISEVKQALHEEKAKRESDVYNLGRDLAKEKAARDADEEKLINMISACMASVSKMQAR